jgi:hypothetical protein
VLTDVRFRDGERVAVESAEPAVPTVSSTTSST